MSGDGSITRWIGKLQSGDGAAAHELWRCYFGQLVELARRKLTSVRLRVADEEDVALSAFDSFCRGLKAGRFPDLQDRNNLWKLLVVLTARKASHQMRDQRRLKRGGDQQSAAADELANLVSQEPTPEFAAEVAENCERLLERLGDDDLRSIALRKMEGYSNDEIAAERQCAPRTVERKLRLIRGLWENESVP